MIHIHELQSLFSKQSAEKGSELKSLAKLRKKDPSEEIFSRADLHLIFDFSTKEPEQTSLEFFKDGNEPDLQCTCSVYEGGELCEHLWASLLSAKELPEIQPYISATEVSTPSKAGPDSEMGDLSWKTYLNFLEETRPALKVESKGAPKKVGYKPLLRTGFYAIDFQGSMANGKIKLHFFMKEHLANGAFTGTKTASVDQGSLALYPDPIDQDILTDLIGKTQPIGSHLGAVKIDSVLIPLSAAEPILRKISDVGKLFLMKERKEMVANKYYLPELTELAFSSETWKLQLVLSQIEDAFYLSARVTDGNKLRKVREIDQKLGPFAIIDNKLVLTQFDQAEKWMELFQRRKEIEIPKGEVKEFLTKVYSKENAPEIVLPSSLEFVNVQDIRPQIQLTFSPTKGSTLLLGKIKFVYDGIEIDPLEKRPAILDVEKGRRLFRDSAEESKALQQFVDFSPLKVNTKSAGGFVSSGYFTEKQLKTIVQKVIPLGWNVLAFQKQVRRPKDYQLTLKSNVDWFDVKLEIDFGGNQVDFPDLLQSIQRGEKYITLGDGSLGILPDEWLQQLKTISEMATLSKKSVKLNRIQALFLSAHLQSLNKLDADADFQGLAKIVEELKSLKPAKASPKFLGQLRPYQEVGLSWLGLLSSNQIGGVLADDMGLGKTIQVLALLAELKKTKTGKPHLIVVPKSLVFNWVDEIKKFTPHLHVLDYTGPKRSTLTKKFSEVDIILTTYPILRMDIEQMRSIHFEYFILDEAHTIKNASSQSAMACRMVEANKKLALTGTPIENSLADLFSILGVVNPGLLGESQAQKWVRERDPEMLSSLGKALSPFLLRRSKEEVLKDLPPKTEQILYCELSPEERQNYDELKKYYWAQITGKISEKGLQKSKIEVLEALLRLRQAACHQGLLKSNMRESLSSKFEVVLEQIQNLISEGHKALVFSQFTSLLELFKNQLNKNNIPFEYLDGQTKNRQERVENFQKNPEIPVFLLSLKAGGVGLNLTAADYVFILDPWWNPAAESQAIDRTHRIGQSRSVFAYKIIAKDTVEEKILEIQRQKKSLAKAVVSDEKSILKSLKIEDLQALFN